MPTVPAWRRRAVMLMLCALSATGCSTPLTPPAPQPVRPVVLPPPPAELMQPPASGSWSESVWQLYRKWQQLLTTQTPA